MSVLVVTEIPVDQIHTSPTARPVLPIKVEELARSIADVGLRSPISVRPMTADRGVVIDYEVRGGGHRLAAFRRLGRATIPAIVRDDDDLTAELAEIDENLVRNELGPAERAAAITRRKAIYEELHPETVHGGNRRSSRQVGDLKPEPGRFTEATSGATGASERSIQRDAQRGEKIGGEALAKVAGTSLDKGEELDALAALSAERRTALIDRAAAGEKVSAKVEAKKERRDTRERELGDKQRALPQRRYGVILADPEWEHEPWSDAGLAKAAVNHYPVSSIETIKARPVGDIAAADSVLFMWSTVPHLDQAIEVIRAWGFAYKTCAIWNKAYPGNQQGMGYWFRINHEILLIATRGNVPAPAPGTQFGSVFSSPPGGHSEKPDWQYELIEAYFPNLPKIELNARRARAGWDSWGLEAPEAESGQEARSDGEAGATGKEKDNSIQADVTTTSARTAPALGASEAREGSIAAAGGMKTLPAAVPPERSQGPHPAALRPPSPVSGRGEESGEDLEIPEALQRTALTDNDRAALDFALATPGALAALTLNQRQFVKLLAGNRERGLSGSSERRYLDGIRAELGPHQRSGAAA